MPWIWQTRTVSLVTQATVKQDVTSLRPLSGVVNSEENQNECACVSCSGATVERAPRSPLFWGSWIIKDDTPQSVGLLWARNWLVAATSTWRHTGRPLCLLPAQQDPRLRPLGRRDLQCGFVCWECITNCGWLLQYQSCRTQKRKRNSDWICKLLWKQSLYVNNRTA